jgi:uncharacterized membrane protein YdbT with pleckstrin-like domain
MSYINDNLMDGERVIYEGRLSIWAIAKWMVPGFLMSPFVFVSMSWGTLVFAMGVMLMSIGMIHFATTEMAVTSMRVIAKTGWIARKTSEISLARVEGVEVTQTMTQRILNFGHILISGVGSHSAHIRNVAEPMEFRKAFLTAVQGIEKVNEG